MRLIVLSVVLIASVSACASVGPLGWTGTAGQPTEDQPPASFLLLYGGANHDVFLGCLTCSEFDATSVQNQFGAHGNAYSTRSILNAYGPYGSDYSYVSACNVYATRPPVVVDQNGGYYGELTMNEFNVRRTQIDGLLGWLAAVCQH